MKNIVMWICILVVIVAGCWLQQKIECADETHLGLPQEPQCVKVSAQQDVKGMAAAAGVGAVYLLVCFPILAGCAWLIVNVPRITERRAEERKNNRKEN